MITFRKATAKDFSFLLRLRNDPSTRAFSRNTAEVTESEHRAWVSMTLANPNRFLYIAEDAGMQVGTVRFDTLEKGSEISWTVAPEARGRGIGKDMLQSALSLHPSPLVAEIKIENIASQKMAEHAGFIRQEDKEGYSVWVYHG